MYYMFLTTINLWFASVSGSRSLNRRPFSLSLSLLLIIIVVYCLFEK